MPTINTKAELLQEMGRLGACKEATEWVTAGEGNADEIWQRCTDVSWLIWFAGRRNPTAIAAFADRCAERAKGYAANARADTAAWAAANANAAYAAAYAAATWAAAVAYADARASAARADAAATWAAAAAAKANAADERALQLADLRQLLPSTN
jgi:hypothetical protein